MITHKIIDNSNEYVMELLADGLIDCSSKNYSPLHEHLSQNLFYKLKSGRFKDSFYIVLEEDGRYVGSSGWYEHDYETAIIFVRTFLRDDMRQKHLLSRYFLPEFLKLKYRRLWITINDNNKSLVNGFTRIKDTRGSSLGFKWHDDFKKFKPIGIQYINGIDQHIIEYENELYEG